MYRLIIADDEPMIVKGISCLADYKAMGFEIVGTYSDGTELLEAVKQGACDVIISDISMPGKNGIDILKYIFENNLPVKVIFISGFSDFEYAHNAIRYGAVDYILKPVGQEALVSALQKVGDVLMRTNIVSEEKTEDALLANEKKAKHGTIDKTAEYYTAINLFVAETESLQEYELIMLALSEKTANILGDDTLVFEKGKYVSAIIGQTVKNTVKLRELCNSLLKELEKSIEKNIRIIIGSTVDNMNKIPESYEKAVNLEVFAYYTEDRIIDETTFSFGEKESNLSALSKCEEEIKSGLIGTDENKLIINLKLAVNMIKKYTLGNVQLTKSYLIALVQMIQRCAVEYAPSESIEILQIGEKSAQEISVLKSFAKDCRVIENCIVSTRKIVMSGNSRLPDEILAAKEYIRRNLKENITLESVANEVYMNPFYFSTFFKKHLNVNFKDYLNSQRLEEAKKLLLGTNKQISEIAVKVGFKSARNFTKIFREVYGVTPTEYKKMRETEQ